MSETFVARVGSEEARHERLNEQTDEDKDDKKEEEVAHIAPPFSLRQIVNYLPRNVDVDALDPVEDVLKQLNNQFAEEC